MWFTITENNFRLSNIPIADYVAYVLSFLRELALQTYRSILIHTPNITWADFKTAFIAKFSPPNINIALLKQITQLKQTTDLNTYVDQFLFLINQTTNISPDSQILMFIQNLKPSLEYRQPTSLQMAIDIAKLYVGSHPIATDSFASFIYTNNTNNATNYNANNNTKWCAIHNSNYHDTRDCRQNKSQRGNYFNKNSNTYRTFNNEQHGPPNQNSVSNNQRPYSQNRPNDRNPTSQYNSYNKPPQRGAYNNTSRYNTPQNSSHNIVDTHQQLPEHIQSTQIEVVESEFLLTTTAVINNSQIEVVIDTACSRSVIPQSFVDSLKIKSFQTDITCTFGNSTQLNNCFVTEQLKISVHDNNQILKFIILPRKNILLGLD